MRLDIKMVVDTRACGSIKGNWCTSGSSIQTRLATGPEKEEGDGLILMARERRGKGFHSPLVVC